MCILGSAGTHLDFNVLILSSSFHNSELFMVDTKKKTSKNLVNVISQKQLTTVQQYRYWQFVFVCLSYKGRQKKSLMDTVDSNIQKFYWQIGWQECEDFCTYRERVKQLHTLGMICSWMMLLVTILSQKDWWIQGLVYKYN